MWWPRGRPVPADKGSDRGQCRAGDYLVGCSPLRAPPGHARIGVLRVDHPPVRRTVGTRCSGHMIAAINWGEVGLGALFGALVGVALWAFLPRGVVLTRTSRTHDWKGEPLFDTWEVANASSLPVRILSVRFSGVTTVHPVTHQVEHVELPWDGRDRTTLEFDDATLENIRGDWQKPWAGTVIGPGETLRAHVEINTSMEICYRRAGWAGMLERRCLNIHGNV